MQFKHLQNKSIFMPFKVLTYWYVLGMASFDTRVQGISANPEKGTGKLVSNRSVWGPLHSPPQRGPFGTPQISPETSFLPPFPQGYIRPLLLQLPNMTIVGHWHGYRSKTGYKIPNKLKKPIVKIVLAGLDANATHLQEPSLMILNGSISSLVSAQ